MARSRYKGCKHRDVVNVFEQSAICLDCGEPICARCRFADCKVLFWTIVIRENAWHGRALSYEDALRTLSSADLLCKVREGGPAESPI